MPQLRPVRRGVQCLVIGATVLVVLLLPANGAEAAAPQHGSYSFTDSFVDPDYCASEGFALDVKEEASGHFEVFFNPDGSFKRANVHRTVTFAISANGHTLHKSDHWQTFVYADGSVREVGLFAHIRGDHGLVLRDAGQIVLNPDDTVAYIRGPHPQFEGQTFCSALLP